jgi:hypothetical protein
MQRTIEQLKNELAELKAEMARREVEHEVKALRKQLFPSKIVKVGHGLLFVASAIVAGAKAFDNGLKALEEKTGI